MNDSTRRPDDRTHTADDSEPDEIRVSGEAEQDHSDSEMRLPARGAEGERRRGACVLEDFDQFWSRYPRRVGKAAARTAFARACRKTTLDVMLAALDWQVKQAQWLEQGGRFVPYPKTWLNQERWLDEHLLDRREQLRVEGDAWIQTIMARRREP